MMPTFDELIETVQSRVESLIRKATLPKPLDHLYPIIVGLLGMDDARREKQRALPYLSSFDAPRHERLIQRRRLRILSAIFAATGSCGCRPEMGYAEAHAAQNAAQQELIDKRRAEQFIPLEGADDFTAAVELRASAPRRNRVMRKLSVIRDLAAKSGTRCAPTRISASQSRRASRMVFSRAGVIDDVTKECLAAVADPSILGRRVARELDAVIARHGKAVAILLDSAPGKDGRHSWY